MYEVAYVKVRITISDQISPASGELHRNENIPAFVDNFWEIETSSDSVLIVLISKDFSDDERTGFEGDQLLLRYVAIMFILSHSFPGLLLNFCDIVERLS